MRERGDRRHAISGAFVFLLLGVFAVFGTVLVLLCAQAYRGTMERTAAHDRERVLWSFVRHAVRAEDEAGAVTVRDMDGVKVLCIADDASDSAYMTCIYAYDGALREQYTDSGMAFRAGRGEEICPAQAFSAAIDGERLTVSVTDGQGRTDEIVAALHCGEVTP